MELFTLRNANGIEVKTTNYGAIITSIVDARPRRRTAPTSSSASTPRRLPEGLRRTSARWSAATATASRRARFTLDGKTYTLAVNNGPNHLHGGLKGFDKVIWKAEPLSGKNGVAFSRRSPDGEEGYPGNLDVRVTYELTDRERARARPITPRPTRPRRSTSPITATSTWPAAATSSAIS